MAKTYSAKQLVATYRAATGWDQDAPFVKPDWCTVLTARQWRDWFAECLALKIVAQDPRAPSSAWRKVRLHLETRRAAWDLNTPRLRVYRDHHRQVAREYPRIRAERWAEVER